MIVPILGVADWVCCAGVAFVVLWIVGIFMPATKCELCGSPLKRKKYKVRIEGKKYVVCPKCNAQTEQRASREAVSRAYGEWVNASDGIVARFTTHERVPREDDPDWQREGESIDRFYSKVVGVTAKEDGGDQRQAAVRACVEGETLYLVREPDNPASSNAIAFIRSTGERVGYLSEFRAEQLAPVLDRGARYKAVVEKVTGLDRATAGLNVLICKTSDAAGTSRSGCSRSSRVCIGVILALLVFAAIITFILQQTYSPTP